jgi:eukaryotic-like serine/threonine-protein kinase
VGCPGTETIQAFFEGHLAADERARTLAHAESCIECFGLLAGLVRSDQDTTPPPPVNDLVVVQPDCYTLGDELARGGMGRIFAARDNRHGRPVAIKMLRDELVSPRRFVREAWISARLQHPAIVPIYEAGRWPTGEPFIAMKRVDGMPLGRVIDQARTLGQRLALVSRLAPAVEAIAYAHANGIVHRDVKPSNILVGVYGEVVVIDWGLAKVIGEPEPEAEAEREAMDASPLIAASMTVVGTVVGTPLYMSPEQARGEAVGPTSDVYSLGAVLYHVLAGAPPYVSAKGPLPVLVGPPAPLGQVAPGVPRDLATIIDKAMARDPRDRYADGAGLAEELGRFTTGDMVRAHTYSAWQLLRRWTGRHRAFVAAAAVASALASAYVVRVVVERDAARRHIAEGHLEQGRQALIGGDRLRSLVYLSAALSEGLAEPGTRFMLERARQAIDKQLAVLEGHTGEVRALALDGAHGRIATGGADATVQIWDADGRKLATIVGHTAGVRSATFSPDGQKLLTTGDDKIARVSDVASGRLLFELVGHSEAVTGALYSGDGKRLVTRSRDKTIRVWDAETGAPMQTLIGHTGPVNALALASDGRRLASGSSDRLAMIWDLETGAVLARAAGHGHAIVAVAFSPDGSRLVTGSYDQTARVFAASDGAPLLVLHGHRSAVVAVAYSGDGRHILTGSHDKSAKLWDPETGVLELTLAGHDGALTVARFASDGTRVLTASVDGTAAIWEASSGKLLSRLIGHTSTVWNALFSKDGGRVVTASLDHTARIWDARADDLRASFDHDGSVLFARFVPGGRVITGSADGNVRVWDATSGDLLRTIAVPDLKRNGERCPRGVSVVVDPAGTRLVIGTGTRVEIRELERETPIASYAVPEGSDGCVTVTDQLVFVSAPGGAVRAMRASDGALVAEYRGDGKSATVLSVSQDGLRVATAGEDDPTTRIWEVASGAQVLAIRQDSIPVTAAFSPDGARLAISTEDALIRIWDSRRGTPLAVLEGHKAAANVLSYNRDGRLLASGGGDTSVNVWDAPSGALLSSFGLHDDTIYAVDFSEDGTRLVTGSFDGTAKIWETSSDQRSAVEVATAVRCRVPFQLDGTRVVRAALTPTGCATQSLAPHRRR